MSQDPSNRRAYLRFPINTLVWWNQDWEPEPVSLIDISAGGMLVEFPTRMNQGALIDLHFEFPGYGRLIQCTCEVAHCRDGEGSFFLIGLRVVDLEGMEHQEFITRLKNGLPISTDTTDTTDTTDGATDPDATDAAEGEA